MTYVFTSTHGVQFTDEDATEPWAHFTFDEKSSSLVDGVATKTYKFETDDAKIAERLRAVDDYGIAEVEAEKPKATRSRAAKSGDGDG